ncbi:hypothetical protein JCM3774_001838 [Rhodotorula dairenensis]
MLRLSSYGAGASPPSPAPAASPPPAAAPPSATATTTPVHLQLQARARELTTIAQTLAAYFTNLAQLHHNHALQLEKLDHLPVPFHPKHADDSLFVPLHTTNHAAAADEHEHEADLGGTGNEGWQDIFHHANLTHARIAKHHAALAKQLAHDVVAPLNKLAFQLKTHAQLVEKELKPQADLVARERQLVQPLYARLANAIALVEHHQQQPPASTSSSSSSRLFGGSSSSTKPSNKPLAAQDDPVLVRAQIEARVRVQLDRERDLAALVDKWIAKCRDRELDAFDTVKLAWSTWEQLHSSTLLEAHQLGMFLAATVDAVPNDKEWLHFVTAAGRDLHAPERSLADVDWVGKGHPLTAVVKEGLLERQTSILKSWKPAYFILTPSGILHIYGPPPASVVLPDPATNADDKDEHRSTLNEETNAAAAGPLSPIAQYLALHSSPHLSLNLSHCFLGPMPTPAPASTSASDVEVSVSQAQGKPVSNNNNNNKKPAALDAVFTLIEATVSNGGKQLTMTSSGTRHVVRCKGENGWEEMGGWVAEIGKYCAVPSVPPPPSPPTPTAPTMASSTAAAVESPATEDAESAALPPATVLARSLPPLPPLTSSSAPTTPPALPERAAAAGGGGGGPPPALPPRDSYVSQASSSMSSATSDARNSLLMSDSGAGDDSMLMMSEGGQSYGDLSHAMASFGLLGAGGGAAAGVVDAGMERSGVKEEEDTPATTIHEGDTDAEHVVPENKSREEEEEDDEVQSNRGDGEESGGDLGRSVPGPEDQQDDDDEDAAEDEDESAAASVTNEDNDDDNNEDDASRNGSGTSKVKNLAAAWEKQGDDDTSKPGDGETAAGLTVPKGKKGKKKRKSKGKENANAASDPAEASGEASPSLVDPESSELGVPASSSQSATFESAPSSPKLESAPSSPKLESAPSSPKLDDDDAPAAVEEEQNVDLGEPAQEAQEKEEEEGEGVAKPPMELEEVVDAPEGGEPQHHDRDDRH